MPAIQAGLKDGEPPDPPPPEIPKPENLPECHPLTGDQLLKAYDHFLNSEIDTRNWIGIKRPSAKKTYRKYGLKTKGKSRGYIERQEIHQETTYKSLDINIIDTGIPLASSEKDILD